MNTKLSFGQRLFADTPVFFKVIQMLAFLVILAASVMAALSIGTKPFQELLETAGAIAIIVSQFAVKESAVFAANGITVSSLITAFTDATATISAVKQTVATPPAIPSVMTAVSGVNQALQDDPSAAQVVQQLEKTAVDTAASEIIKNAASQMKVLI